MILWSRTRREVGKVYMPELGITDYANQLHPPQPVYVIREATHEEWAADVSANGGDPSLWGEFPYYYKVSMD